MNEFLSWDGPRDGSLWSGNLLQTSERNSRHIPKFVWCSISYKYTFWGGGVGIWSWVLSVGYNIYRDKQCPRWSSWQTIWPVDKSPSDPSDLRKLPDEWGWISEFHTPGHEKSPVDNSMLPLALAWWSWLPRWDRQSSFFKYLRPTMVWVS